MALTVDGRKLAQALVKVTVDAVKWDIGGVVKGVADAAVAFGWSGPADPTAEEGARLLLQRGAYTAAIHTIQRFAREAPVLATEVEPREIEAALSGLAAGHPLELTAAAFAAAEHWPALEAILETFGTWLRVCGVAEDRRAPMRRAFREDFIIALAAELRDQNRADDYRALLSAVERKTPLDKAAQRTLDWQSHRARLIEAAHAPLRSLAPELIPPYSLFDLYVPLRAAIEAPTNTHREEGERRQLPIRWLDPTLDAWIDAAKPGDAIRVLSGDPGSGKSSACAMLAARQARKGRQVILVPLSRLNYAGDARAELTRFIQEELGHDGLGQRPAPGEPPLLLILDGLDELAKAGQGAVAVLSGFVGNLGFLMAELNRDGVRVLLLLAGRPGAADTTDSIARGSGARLHVLRYLIDPDKITGFDDGELAKLDQRSDWWSRFQPGQGMPEPLKGNHPQLAEVTA